MGRITEKWICREIADGPEGFPFAVLSGEEVISWARRREDAEFMARAREVVPRLVDEITILMTGIDNIRNFVHTLDIDLSQLDAEMKNRL